MPLTRRSFTIRSLMVAVALVALNLTGAIATFKYCHGPQTPELGGFGGDAPRQVAEDGFIWEYGWPNTQTLRSELVYVMRVPLPPTLLRIWSPVMASASITLLVLIVWLWDWGALRRGMARDTGRAAYTRPRRLWLTPRWSVIVIPMSNEEFQMFCWLWLAARWMVVIIVAPIALNLAAAVSRPTPDGYKVQLAMTGLLPSPHAPDHVLDYRDLFAGTPRLLNVGIDGGIVHRLRMDVPGEDVLRVIGGHPAPMAASHEETPRVPARGEDAMVAFAEVQRSSDAGSAIGEATIDYRSDGGIVAYAGRPGKMLSHPRWLRPPSFSFLEMRWPVVASASITVLVLVLLWRRARRQREDPSTSVERNMISLGTE